MNKKKLVELAEEVLTNIDAELQTKLRKELEKELCDRLSRIFLHGNYHLTWGHQKGNEGYKKSYDSVKPILDDTIDKLLNNKNL
jgi:hypothetical protein